MLCDLHNCMLWELVGIKKAHAIDHDGNLMSTEPLVTRDRPVLRNVSRAVVVLTRGVQDTCGIRGATRGRMSCCATSAYYGLPRLLVRCSFRGMSRCVGLGVAL